MMDTGLTMEKELYEFPVLIEETNEIVTLFLSQNEMERANQGNINILFYFDLFNA